MELVRRGPKLGKTKIVCVILVAPWTSMARFSFNSIWYAEWTGETIVFSTRNPSHLCCRRNMTRRSLYR
jgi:hypothetical protein